MTQETLERDKRSLIADITLRQFVFRIDKGSINGVRAGELLQALLLRIPGASSGVNVTVTHRF